MSLSPEEYKKWLYKRKLTVITFAFENVLIGADFSLTFITLWLYLKEMVKPDRPKIYYSLISASYLISSMSFAVVLGRIIDKYRRIKLTFIILNALVIIGNILYTIQFSPLYLLFGRFLSGMGGPLRSVISGELARCCHTEELSRYLSVMGLSFSFGFVSGPAINFFFENVNFYIGEWHIAFVNAPGLFLALLFLIVLLMSMFMVFDLSKENDIKADMEKKNIEYCQAQCHLSDSGKNLNCNLSANNQKETISYFHHTEESPLIQGNTIKKNLSVLYVLKKLITNLDTSLLLGAAFFENYFVVSFDIWLPMLVVEIIHWDEVKVNMIVLGSGVFCIIACLILIFKKFSDKSIYIIALCATSSIILMEGIFMFLSHYSKCVVLNIVSFILVDAFYSFLIITEEVFLVGCLAKMVSSEIQTFVDSIRLTMYRLGGLIALATSALVFDYIAIVGLVHIAIIFAGTLLLIARRKTLMNPELIVK